MERYQSVTLSGDIMKVNKIPFMVTINTAIKFGTTEVIKNQKATTIMTAITHVYNVYRGRGFNVKDMGMDGEFEPLRGNLASIGITLNTASRDEHVPDIERRIRTIKERARSTYNTLPFNKLPAQMTVQMVYHSNFWLNVFTPSPGVSGLISPRELMTGQRIDYNKHCKLEYGAYAQVHEQHDNSITFRSESSGSRQR
ncbi:expressed unknown protein [Seminavis robusta]|uniref:Uncharacterized protein n=1 Tax=Seminavis robusta TaxID=568900 RepID=A0A9N8F3A5_9STRA|nr:expressed unknown protein [Seminavis robusta]|eukprot:Sro3039_g342611.1  (198) ;mRNA; r:2154-2747